MATEVLSTRERAGSREERRVGEHARKHKNNPKQQTNTLS